MITTVPAAFADHSEVTITTVDGSGFGQDCALANGGSGCYVTLEATVDVGGKVIFSNPDASPHTFTAGTIDGFAQSPSGEFDTSILMQDESGEWIPDTVGTVPYYCSLHVWMTGTIIVQEAAKETMDETHVDEVRIEDNVEVTHEEAMMENDVELMVTITDSVVLGGTQVDLEFNKLHVNYEITATQNGETVLQETAHSMEMTASHMVDAVGSDENPIMVEIVSLGIGAPGAEADWTGPVGSVATTQVVPEFGTIAMMILVVAIISIVAVTAKSRVIPKF